MSHVCSHSQPHRGENKLFVCKFSSVWRLVWAGEPSCEGGTAEHLMWCSDQGDQTSHRDRQDKRWELQDHEEPEVSQERHINMCKHIQLKKTSLITVHYMLKQTVISANKLREILKNFGMTCKKNKIYIYISHSKALASSCREHLQVFVSKIHNSSISTTIRAVFTLLQYSRTPKSETLWKAADPIFN